MGTGSARHGPRIGPARCSSPVAEGDAGSADAGGDPAGGDPGADDGPVDWHAARPVTTAATVRIGASHLVEGVTAR